MAFDKDPRSEALVARLTQPEDDPQAIAAAADALRRGALVAVPTETVYGLACDAASAEAVARLYAAKGRPSINPLIAHVADLAAAHREGVFDQRAERLAEAFWPGPLTLVLPRQPDCRVCEAASAGLSTLALRLPAAPLMRALAGELGRPIAAPSANLSGRISATTAEAVLEDLGGEVAVVLDSGPSPVGVESTIVDLSGPEARLLRPGGLARRDIEAVLGAPLAAPPVGAESAPAAPGLLSSHYAPEARVRLAATEVGEGEALLAFGPDLPAGAEQAVAVVNLSPRGDLNEAAAALFAALRRLDRSGAATIAVAPIPGDGLGEAIRDRLRRAAAPRGKPDRPD
ncbi:L-threonylcarbamoyladenylate synthase [Amorphus orientalis]|uniref:Threonylcarbamoyl-AMP synthase n=1 Tax=Amorphus orientalis TaxID=649198 RepID=A0AAE4ARR4_9HYPH|nr:L-threonylcarbamoyladenylate synthase [Amorphus orientalis]MDQ0314368.1 L-threonylcarbamoyladenylate synthase [Amorphus orientalis]